MIGAMAVSKNGSHYSLGFVGTINPKLSKVYNETKIQKKRNAENGREGIRMKKNVITNNLALKILAVISAVLLWVIVINISDPVSDTTISGVPVSILNADEITSQGKVYEVLSGSDTITVSLSAKRSILSAIEKDDIRATADINDLNEEDGTIKIKVETTKYNDKIETLKAKTEYVLIKIENLMKKQIVVTADILGEPAEGYVVGDIVLDQNVVRLSGPESVIEKISSAEDHSCFLDVTNVDK